eukprot:2259379-Amphidinium_carterae.1
MERTTIRYVTHAVQAFGDARKMFLHVGLSTCAWNEGGKHPHACKDVPVLKVARAISAAKRCVESCLAVEWLAGSTSTNRWVPARLVAFCGAWTCCIVPQGVEDLGGDSEERGGRQCTLWGWWRSWSWERQQTTRRRKRGSYEGNTPRRWKELLEQPLPVLEALPEDESLSSALS